MNLAHKNNEFRDKNIRKIRAAS